MRKQFFFFFFKSLNDFFFLLSTTIFFFLSGKFSTTKTLQEYFCDNKSMSSIVSHRDRFLKNNGAEKIC